MFLLFLCHRNGARHYFLYDFRRKSNNERYLSVCKQFLWGRASEAPCFGFIASISFCFFAVIFGFSLSVLYLSSANDFVKSPEGVSAALSLSLSLSLFIFLSFCVPLRAKEGIPKADDACFHSRESEGKGD